MSARRLHSSPLMLLALFALACVTGCGAATSAAAQAEPDTPALAQAKAVAADWPVHGRDVGGARYSPLTQIDTANVQRLQVAWTLNTGEPLGPPNRGPEPSLQVTPLVVAGTMYVITPLGRVMALDAATGAERWRYSDATVNRNSGFGDFASRGVSYWRDARRSPSAPCAARIFATIIDARLVALDAATGRTCADFGAAGVVNLRDGLRIAPFEFQAYQHTSPPLVVGELVVTGSSIADNSRSDPASGEVRGWDARTGALRWSFDPIPQGSARSERDWRNGSETRTGAANVWTVMAADPERDLIFLATSSAAPDYSGVLRPGDNRHANSTVALRASTGALVWSFQTVHHDLWDFDNASPPALATVTRDGQRIPVVLQATKTGMLYVLHRETGVPVFGVEERPVPASDVPLEMASPTQPFTTVTPPLVPHQFTTDDVWGATAADREACRAIVTGLRNEGIFTPPSVRGTLVIPSNIGGAHWGGVAVHELLGLAIVPVNRIAAVVQLIPDSADVAAMRTESGRMGLDYQYTRMRGTGYWMRRRLLRAPSGLPCTPPPFGALVAVSLRDGSIAWNVPLGEWPGGAGDAGALPSGSGAVNLGGAIATAGGLVFIGATIDRTFRAFDARTGRVLWSASLPASARATPMTYAVGGRQYVAVAAGGGGAFGSGDVIVVYALPQSR